MCPVHQMIVSGYTGSFVALGSLGSEGGGSPVPEVVRYFGSGGILLLLCILCLSIYSVLLDFFFGVYHPNLLLCFCKWDKLVPIHIILLLVVLLHQGLDVLLLGAQSLWVV